MMRWAHKTLLAVLAVLAVGTTEPAAQGNCAPNWTPNQYKSFSDIQNEIKKQYGEVRILRVALCDQGGNAYFQVVIISGRGEVRRIQLAASSK